MEILELSEELVDKALVGLLNQSREFRNWFLARVLDHNGESVAAISFRGANRSVYHLNGESDVVVEWAGPGRRRVIVLLETKVNATFQERQGRRYADRARRIAKAEAATVRTVLLAPEHYLRAANPEATWFEVHLSLEDLVHNARTVGTRPEVEILETILRRVHEGGALGAKGLFPCVHAAIAAECERRGNGFRITNNATDWVFFDHPLRVRGVEIRYRIADKTAELAFTTAFRGDRDAVLSRARPPLTTAESGSYKFVRAPRLITVGNKDTFSDADAAQVVDVLERLIAWWGDVRASTLGKS